MIKIRLFFAGLIMMVPALIQAAPLNIQGVSASNTSQVQANQTYTYVRCWYRPAHNHDDPSTDWEWAKDEHGDNYTIEGYWWSSVSFKNMFFTQTSQNEIEQRCKDTLGVTHASADILYYASDNRFSYNHSIWTNDMSPNAKINRIIAFGDSLSDTGNLYNGSQWVFPNRDSWFLGHFSNGLVWTEYLAKNKEVPLYNWSVGGAAGTNQYVALTGIYDQVTSFLTYMKMAKHYNPDNSLITLEFGLNDFMNYQREVADVKADLSSALIRLTETGTRNILLFTLPDATKAPQFKYTTPETVATVRQKIIDFNAFIAEQALLYQDKGLNVVLYDAHDTFEKITTHPQQHGFENSTEPCLNINRNSSMDYLYRHDLTDDCAYHGSDKYVFWGVTHPTTATHQYIADHIIQTKLGQFNF